MSRSRLALILGAILLFGLVTFALGVVVGLGMGPRPTAPPAGTAPGQPPAAQLPASPSVTADDPGPPGNSAQAGGAAPNPAAGADAGAQAPGGEALAEAPPAPPIVMVSSLTSAPADGGAASPLLGPLAAQAAAPVLPPPDPVEPPPPSDRVISVQVGRFVRQDNAAELAARLSAAGFRPQIVATELPGMPVWYIVTLGELPDEPAARRVAGEVSRSLGLPATVVNWAKPEG